MRFGLTSLSLYGVYGPEDIAEFFDIDLVVSFDGPTSSKRFFGVQHYIEDRLWVKVGVMTKRSLSEERRRLFEEIAIDVWAWCGPAPLESLPEGHDSIL